MKRGSIIAIIAIAVFILIIIIAAILYAVRNPPIETIPAPIVDTGPQGPDHDDGITSGDGKKYQVLYYLRKGQNEYQPLSSGTFRVQLGGESVIRAMTGFRDRYLIVVITGTDRAGIYALDTNKTLNTWQLLASFNDFKLKAYRYGRAFATFEGVYFPYYTSTGKIKFLIVYPNQDQETPVVVLERKACDTLLPNETLTGAVYQREPLPEGYYIVTSSGDRQRRYTTASVAALDIVGRIVDSSREVKTWIVRIKTVRGGSKLIIEQNGKTVWSSELLLSGRAYFSSNQRGFLVMGYLDLDSNIKLFQLDIFKKGIVVTPVGGISKMTEVDMIASVGNLSFYYSGANLPSRNTLGYKNFEQIFYQAYHRGWANFVESGWGKIGDNKNGSSNHLISMTQYGADLIALFNRTGKSYLYRVTPTGTGRWCKWWRLPAIEHAETWNTGRYLYLLSERDEGSLLRIIDLPGGRVTIKKNARLTDYPIIQGDGIVGYQYFKQGLALTPHGNLVSGNGKKDFLKYRFASQNSLAIVDGTGHYIAIHQDSVVIKRISQSLTKRWKVTGERVLVAGNKEGIAMYLDISKGSKKGHQGIVCNLNNNYFNNLTNIPSGAFLNTVDGQYCYVAVERQCDGWSSEWTDGRSDCWTDRQSDGWTDGTGEWTDGTGECKKIHKDGWTDGTGEWTDGTGEWTGGRSDCWTNEQSECKKIHKDGWTDGTSGDVVQTISLWAETKRRDNRTEKTHYYPRQSRDHRSWQTVVKNIRKSLSDHHRSNIAIISRSDQEDSTLIITMIKDPVNTVKTTPIDTVVEEISSEPALTFNQENEIALCESSSEIDSLSDEEEGFVRIK